MLPLTNTAASRIAASLPIWIVVFMMIVLGAFTFGSSDDWRLTTLVAVVLVNAAVISALLCSVRRRAG